MMKNLFIMNPSMMGHHTVAYTVLCMIYVVYVCHVRAGSTSIGTSGTYAISYYRVQPTHHWPAQRATA